MADGSTSMTVFTEYVIPGIAAIGGGIASGVTSALRNGSRIASLEKSVVTEASLKVAIDAAKEEARQLIASSLASVARGGISDADVRRIVDATIATSVQSALAKPLAEIQGLQRDLDRMQRQMAEDARYADQKASELDRLIGRFERSLEMIDKG
jgi:hypothetical protein